MRKQANRYTEFKVQSRQRWPKPEANRIKAIRPPPRKSSRQKSNPKPSPSSESSLVRKLYKSIAERDVKMVKEILNELNLMFIKGGVFDETAMQAARRFIRELDSPAP